MRRRVANVEAGFTLMEVMIALAILALSLGVLLSAQSSSLNNAARARDITIASLLTRSKMIDIEQTLFDEGFVEGDTDEKGDFGDDGHDEIKWAYSISEIELDLTGLSSMCGGFGEEGGDSNDCEAMFSSFGGMLEGFVSDFGRSVRLIELTVTWPVGPKYTESMLVRSIVTRDDFGFAKADPFPPDPQ